MTAKSIWGILVAGGSGNRFSGSGSKLLARLGQKTVFQHSVEALLSLSQLNGLVIVYHPQWEADYRQCVATVETAIPLLWSPGGVTRRDSVWQGLLALPATAEIVLIHDAARPLVDPHRIENALTPVLTEQAKGTSLGIPATNTLKQVAFEALPWVENTLERGALWQVHTPQVFQKSVLINAHKAIPADIPLHDDAELVERSLPYQQAVLMVEDTAVNFKITTPADLQLAEAYLMSQSRPAVF